MGKGKLGGVVVFVLIIAAAIYIFNCFKGEKRSYEALYITYNDNKQEFIDIQVDDVIVIDNISFWVVSTAIDSVVLNSSEYLSVGKNSVNEIEVEMNSTQTACMDANKCIYFELK